MINIEELIVFSIGYDSWTDINKKQMFYGLQIKKYVEKLCDMLSSLH